MEWAAEWLRVDNVCGSIREGLAADLVVLSADPLVEIKVLTHPENIATVVKGGRSVCGLHGVTNGGNA